MADNDEGETMYRVTGFLAVACALVGGAAWGADLTGRWSAVGNNVEVTLELKVEGNVVTGAVVNPRSGPAEIRDGRIDGDAISFYVVRTANNATTKILWQGTVAGEEIHFTRRVDGGNDAGMQVIAKRAR